MDSSDISSKSYKTYTELMTFTTYEDRLRYLQTKSSIGVTTFGTSRYLNQMFYSTPEWKRTRDIVILRDNGCDLGLEGLDIHSHAIIHHINPITEEDIVNRNPILFDPNNLITVSKLTHNKIHYGVDTLSDIFVERKSNDTCPWKQ